MNYREIACISNMNGVYRRKFDQLVSKVKPILNTQQPFSIDGKNSVSCYTPHDFDHHCCNIYHIISERLFQDHVYSEKNIKPEELFLLNVAVLFHDISMAKNFRFKREIHSLASAERLVELHQENPAISDAINEEFIASLTEIIKAHSDIKDPSVPERERGLNCSRLTNTMPCGPCENLRAKMLAVILRVADELDITISRYGNGYFLKMLNPENESERESITKWNLLNYFSTVSRDPNNGNQLLIQVHEINIAQEIHDNGLDTVAKNIISVENKVSKEMSEGFNILREMNLSFNPMLVRKAIATTTNPELNKALIRLREVPFAAVNDYFAGYTVTHRFKEKLVELGMTLDRSEKVNFTQDEFEKIIPEKIKSSDKHYEHYIEKFINDISPYKDKEISRFYKNAPFILVEHYFYYDILRKKNKIADPYRRQKRNALYFREPPQSSKEEYRKYIDFSNNLKELVGYYDSAVQNSNNKAFINETLKKMMLCCLIGNTTDLSQLKNETNHKNNTRIINDDRDHFLSFIEKKKKLNKVDFIIDNTDFELICNIVFITALIKLNIIEQANFHINVLPIYVSDTTESDYGEDPKMVLERINQYCKSINSSLYSDIAFHMSKNKMMWKPDMYWNMYFSYSDTVEDFNRIIDDSDLVIVTGDLNYRRLVGDIRRDSTTSIASVVNYLNYPCLVFRSIKSSNILNLSRDDIKKVEEAYIGNKDYHGEFSTLNFLPLTRGVPYDETRLYLRSE